MGPLLLLDTAGCDMDEQAEEGSGSKYNDGEAEVCSLACDPIHPGILIVAMLADEAFRKPSMMVPRMRDIIHKAEQTCSDGKAEVCHSACAEAPAAQWHAEALGRM